MPTSSTATTIRSQPSSGGRNAVAIAIPYAMTKYRMSCTRTPVSTTIAVPAARRRRQKITPTPVTNIASVESMNGAPRMAPTPIASVSAPPPPKAIAMIGIIVSGKAVPTAASTDPTAPCARSSFRPNHSMPFVNSSAPTRITTNATTSTRASTSALQRRGGGDGDEHDDEHEERDHGEPPVARRDEPEAGHGDPADRQRDHEQDPGPQEALGAERDDRRRDVAEVEGRDRAVAQRVDPRGQREHDADRDEAHGDPGPGDQQAADRGLHRIGGVRAGARRRGSGHSARALIAIWSAVYRSTTTNSQRRTRTSTRCATRDPSVAPANTPSAMGPATNGSISSRSR